MGEFSTGKSTFINALLRKELLVSSALQGTTVASTVIDYSERQKIELEYLNGSCEKLYYNTFGELRKGLEHFTTNSSIAKQLKAVNVFLPVEILKNDFRIIDTPGTNVTEAWHEDVTVRALREKSDLSIILTSAEKPVPDTMFSFVRKNLESILPQCVFVVTKLDMLRPRERDRQLAYIKMRLEEKLEIQEAVVLPYVSPMVLCSEMSTDDKHAETKRICIVGWFGVGKKSLVEAIIKNKLQKPIIPMGNNFVAPIVKFAYDQKPVVKMKLNESFKFDSDFYSCCPSGLAKIIKKYKGVNLPEIESIYEIFCDLNQISKDYEHRLELLNRSQKADLSIFVQKEKGERLQSFDMVAKDLSEGVEQVIYANAAAAYGGAGSRGKRALRRAGGFCLCTGDVLWDTDNC